MKFKPWLSSVQIVFWISLFSFFLVIILVLVFYGLRLNQYNKDEIIAMNLAREQIELFKNIRDSNYEKTQKFNQINPDSDNYNKVFEIGKYYKIENNFLEEKAFPIKVEEINNFSKWKNYLSSKMLDYKLCLDSNNSYVYDCSWNNRDTYFYKYIKIDKLSHSSGKIDEVLDDAYTVTSKVIWNNGGYYETEVRTIVTDWRNL